MTARRIPAEIAAAIGMRLIVGVAALIVILSGTAQAKTGEELAFALRDNVVQITADWRDGTSQNGFGFIVGEEDGTLVVVTANHVVRGKQVDQIAERVLVTFYQKRGRTFEATLLDTSDPSLDLAVLEVPLPSGMRPPSDFGAESAAERHMPVWFVGRGADWFVPAEPGTVNRVNELTHEIDIEKLLVQVGSSGAPLIGESGIVGMIVEDKGGDVSGATRIEAIRAAMTDWNLPWQLERAQVNQVSTPCDLTGTWIHEGATYSLTQNGTSVGFRYDTDTVEHYGSGTYEKDGQRVVLKLVRVVRSNQCRLNGTVEIEIVTCSVLQHTTRWDPGCDLPQGLSEEGMSRRSP